MSAIAASIRFIFAGGSYIFDAEGVPQWDQRSEYEVVADGTPKLKRTTYTIAQTFSEQAYADNEARINRLRNALNAAEGTLVIEDENGVNLVNVPVRVKSDTVPRAWRQYLAEVTVSFEARTLTAAAAALPATFTPPGFPAVALPNVSSWKVGIRTSRFSNQAVNRDESIETISASGFILADRSQTPAQRLAFLQAQAELLRRCNSRDGKLKWGTEERTVRVQSLDADMSDGKDRLNWELTAFYRSFPAGSYAQPEYTVSLRRDYEAGDLITSVRGKVKADTETDAKNAITALKESYDAPARHLQNDETGDAIVDGIDGKSWLEVSFSFEYREPIPDFIGYQLRISTKDDARSSDKIITYEGRVSGTNATAALEAARALGLGKFPGIISTAETVATKKNSFQPQEVFVEVSFTYEYLAKSSTLRYAEITREVAGTPFADQREVISGYVAAETLTAAEEIADSFQLTGRFLRDKNKRYGQRLIGAAASQALKIDFSFTYYLTPVSVGLSYGVETTNDFAAVEKSVVISGIARGPDENACNAAIDLLIGARGEKRVNSSRKSDFEKQVATSPESTPYFVSVSFTERFVGVPSDGASILSANYSIRTSYSINKASMTLIPFGIPFVQPNVGVTPGLQTVSGSVTARSASAARSWGGSKKSMLRSGGYDDVVEDDLQTNFAPLDSSQVARYVYSFTFSARYQQLSPSLGGGSYPEIPPPVGSPPPSPAPPTEPEIILRRDILILVGGDATAANHLDLRLIPVLSIYRFVIDGNESDWSVELGDVTDVDDPEQISMFNYNATTNNKHLKKVIGY